MTLAEFLLARIADDEARFDRATEAEAYSLRHDGMPDTTAADIRNYWLNEVPTEWPRWLAECEAKRRIVEFHANWPVLIEGPNEFKQDDDSNDVSRMTLRMSRQVAWLTEQEYIKRFGTEPPTAPMLRALAAVYADHQDFREEWRL
jgi:hypothetical protein